MESLLNKQSLLYVCPDCEYLDNYYSDLICNSPLPGQNEDTGEEDWTF